MALPTLTDGDRRILATQTRCMFQVCAQAPTIALHNNLYSETYGYCAEHATFLLDNAPWMAPVGDVATVTASH